MIGRTISHYHVLEKLGEGGMGVVYKAQDSLLNRQVALKVLPVDAAMNLERRGRLLREAQAASALSHPNIVTVHDVLRQAEGDVIVMELVPGRTLDQLIPRKGMPLGQALKVGVQIASALEAAHEAGIVHRDLKPGNIIVGDDGRVRVLDFGLAKLTAPMDASEEEATSTRAGQDAPKTREGQVLGTVSYMSPEQAEGRPVDARSDIFSFGVVLYEMVAGHRPFRGTSSASTLAAVLKDDPGRLPAEIPHDLEKLIERCLRKDPQRRTRHMADVRLALEDLKEESDSGSLTGQVPAGARPSRRPGWRAVTAPTIAVVVAAAVGAWWWRAHRPGGPEAPMREIPFTSEPSYEGMPRFSPDGSTVAFHRFPAVQDRTTTPVDSIEAKVVGSEGTVVLHTPGSYPVFSPDGRWIAYYGHWDPSASKARIEIVPRIGGMERAITEVGVPRFPDKGVAWTADGEWLVSTDREAPESPLHLVLVSVKTGEKRRLTTPPTGSFGDTGPALSPDGRTLAFTRHTVWGASGLVLLALDAEHRPADEPRPIAPGVPAANAAAWTPDGQEIIFCSRVFHAATLWRTRADGRSPPRPLGLGGRGAYSPDIDATGTKLLYMTQVWDLNVWRLALLPSGLPAGAPEAFLRSNLVDSDATFSPDGRQIAFTSERSGTPQLWLSDSEGTGMRQLTSLEGTIDPSAEWSPDGKQIAFTAAAAGRQHLYLMSPGGGAPRQLTSGPTDDEYPSWSPDGLWIRFESKRGGASRTWKVPREGGAPARAEGERTGVRDPSGAYLYRSEQEEKGWSIRRQPIGVGAAESVVQGAFNWAFAVSRTGIYFTQGRAGFVSPTHIAFREFATGRTTKVADLRPGTSSGSRLSVSPDGRYLLYTQCDQETSDLMLVENFR